VARQENHQDLRLDSRKTHRASDLFLMRTLSYAYANPHTCAFGSYLIDMVYAPTTVVNGTLSQYLRSDYQQRQHTLPVLRAVRLRLLAILCRRTTKCSRMWLDWWSRMQHFGSEILGESGVLSLASETQSPRIASDEAPTVDDHKECNE